MRCPICNSEQSINNKICNQCGYDLEEFLHIQDLNREIQNLQYTVIEFKRQNYQKTAELQNIQQKLNNIETLFTNRIEQANNQIAILQNNNNVLHQKLSLSNKKIEDLQETIRLLKLRKDVVNEEEPMNEIQIGDSISFGSYKQGKDEEVLQIDWIVLDKKDGKLLLLSKDILECQPYNNTYDPNHWADCSLNKWLNKEFYDEAFSEQEKGRIELTEVESPSNLKFETDGGNNSKDYIFVLSLQEIEKYFGLEHKENNHRWPTIKSGAIAQGSEYAKNRTDLDFSVFNGNSWWWLRSPGNDLKHAAIINPNGYADLIGYIIDNSKGGVRPALWLKDK